MKTSINHKLFAGIVNLVFCILSEASAVTIHNASNDFGGSNPGGVWSYLYTSTSDPSSTLNLLDSYHSNGDLDIWSSLSAGDPPSVVKNISTGIIEGLQPGGIALHPGPANQNAVLRFTVPDTSDYDLSIQFFGGAAGDTDAYILLNGNTLSPLFYATTTNSSPLWENALSLISGDVIDIMVGSKGAYDSDTTPVHAVITAVPEPSSSALLIAAGVMFFAFRRR